MTNKARTKVSAFVLAMTTVFTVGNSAYAQDVGTDSQGLVLEEIVVTGIRGSLKRALDQKRNAVGVVDAISAEDLGKFPDLNLSESIQRIPGVTLNRGLTGEGQQINLRGLGPEFSRVEVNGMTGPGSDGNRSFSFDIFPSELFSNVTVEKTSRASQAEGGLAGVVSLETPKPLENDGQKFSVAAQGNYGRNSGDTGTRVALLGSKNFGDTFGISAGFVTSDAPSQSFSAGDLAARPLSSSIARADGVPVTGTPEQLAALTPNVLNFIAVDEDREVNSGNVTLQWRPSEKLEIFADVLYSEVEKTEFNTRFDSPPESNITSITNAVIQNGVVTSGTLGNGVQQRVGANNESEDEEITQFVLRADYKINDNLSVKPYFGVIEREISTVRQLLSFRRADLATGQFVGASVDFTRRGDFVDFTTTGTNFSDPARANEFLFNIFINRPEERSDEDTTAKLDFEWTPQNLGALSTVNFGARLSDREIDQSALRYFTLVNAGVDRRTLPSVGSAPFIYDDVNIDGASIPGQLVSVNPVDIFNLVQPNGIDGPPAAGFRFNQDPRTPNLAQTFNLQEETTNLYAEGTWEWENLVVNAGGRYLDTDQTSSGFAFTNGVSAPITADNSYSEFLPSVSARYEVKENMFLRASYARTLTRPSLNSLSPSENVLGVDEGGGTGSQGNPDLEPFTADNFDIGFEWYFADEALFSFSLFKKDLDGIIDNASFTANRTFPRQADGVLVTAPIIFVRPENGVGASVEGFEIAFQTPFTFLPEGPLQDFGVFVNFTNVDSEADFQTAGDVRSSGLPGLSENSLNAALYFDNGRFDARLAYAWRDDYLETFAADFGIPRFQEGFGQLDFSANYKVNDNLTLQFQALNLTEEQAVFQTTERRLAAFVRQLESRFIFGARYSF